MEVTESNKRATLLRRWINYDRKKFYGRGPKSDGESGKKVNKTIGRFDKTFDFLLTFYSRKLH